MPARDEDTVRTARIDEGADVGRNDRRALVAWAAGFIDGEGCILIYNHYGNYHLRLTASQKDPRPLVILKDLFGGSIYTAMQGGFGSTKKVEMTCWRTSAKAAVAALQEMLPHLVVKADQARVALEFQRVKWARRRRRLSAEDRELESMYAAKIRELR